jgi:hypothetical protein
MKKSRTEEWLYGEVGVVSITTQLSIVEASAGKRQSADDGTESV